VQKNKTNYMSDEAFADLKEAMEDALAFERGQRRDLRVTRIQAPRPPKTMSLKDIAGIRQKLNSQHPTSGYAAMEWSWLVTKRPQGPLSRRLFIILTETSTSSFIMRRLRLRFGSVLVFGFVTQTVSLRAR
jgi:hypothetical protein